MKESKVNIICLYWLGDFRGRDFSLNDVERLHKTVSKHIDRPFEFYVITNTTEDLPEHMNRVEMKYDWPGWWGKTLLHDPALPIPQRRTLYMDLDSHCISSLAPILDYLPENDDLMMFPTGIADRKRDRLEREIPKWVVRYQAATMLFTPGKASSMRKVWEKFMLEPPYWMRKYRSEQDIMGEWTPNLIMMPRKWYCKLQSCEKHFKDSPPKDVIIVTGQDKTALFRNTHRIPWFEQVAR